MATITDRDKSFIKNALDKGYDNDRAFALLNKARARNGLPEVKKEGKVAEFFTGIGKGLYGVGSQLTRLAPGDQKADPNSTFNQMQRNMQGADAERQMVGQDPNSMTSKVGQFVGETLPTIPLSMGVGALAGAGTRGLASVAPKVASKIAPFTTLPTKASSLGNVMKFGALEGAKDQAIYDKLTTGETSLGSIALGATAGSVLGAAFRGGSKLLSKEPNINTSKAGAYTETGIPGIRNLTSLPKRLDKTYRVDPTKYVEFQKMTKGKTIGEFAAERGIVDTPEEAVIQFTKRGRDSMAEADKGLDAITGNYKNDKLQKAITDLRDEAIAAEDDAVGKIANDLLQKHDTTGLTMKEINEAKRLYEKHNKFNYLRANDAKAYRRATNLDDAIREFQFQQADLNGFPELRAINKETQANFAAANAIQNKLTKQLGNNEFGLTDWIVASGAMQNPQALGVLLGKKFMSSDTGQKLFNKLLQKFDSTPRVKPPVANVENIGKMQTFKQSFNDSVPRLPPPLSNSKSGNRLIPDEVVLPTGETGMPTSKGPYPSSDPTITSRSKIVKPGTYTETTSKLPEKKAPIPKTEVKANLPKESKLPKKQNDWTKKDFTKATETKSVDKYGNTIAREQGKTSAVDSITVGGKKYTNIDIPDSSRTLYELDGKIYEYKDGKMISEGANLPKTPQVEGKTAVTVKYTKGEAPLVEKLVKQAEALKPKADEVIVYQSGKSDWVDTDINKQVARGIDTDTRAFIVKKSDLIVDTAERAKEGIYKVKPKSSLPLSSKSEVKYSKPIEESFVTKKPIKVYRGTGKGIGNSTLVKGQYFADSKKFASEFGDVTEFEIPKGSKIFDLDSVKYGDGSIPKELLVDQDKLTNYIIKKGYDYTRNTNSRGVEYVKLNKVKNKLESLAMKSDSLSEFKRKVMENYDEFREELARLSKNYTNADNSRMRSPMEDIWNNLNK